MIESWPNEEELAERCGCGHMLGQHSYGMDLAPCEECRCKDFHDPGACPIRARWPSSSCVEHPSALAAEEQPEG